MTKLTGVLTEAQANMTTSAHDGGAGIGVQSYSDVAGTCYGGACCASSPSSSPSSPITLKQERVTRVTPKVAEKTSGPASSKFFAGLLNLLGGIFRKFKALDPEKASVVRPASLKTNPTALKTARLAEGVIPRIQAAHGCVGGIIEPNEKQQREMEASVKGFKSAVENKIKGLSLEEGIKFIKAQCKELSISMPGFKNNPFQERLFNPENGLETQLIKEFGRKKVESHLKTDKTPEEDLSLMQAFIDNQLPYLDLEASSPDSAKKLKSQIDKLTEKLDKLYKDDLAKKESLKATLSYLSINIRSKEGKITNLESEIKDLEQSNPHLLSIEEKRAASTTLDKEIDLLNKVLSSNRSTATELAKSRTELKALTTEKSKIDREIQSLEKKSPNYSTIAKKRKEILRAKAEVEAYKKAFTKKLDVYQKEHLDIIQEIGFGLAKLRAKENLATALRLETNQAVFVDPLKAQQIEGLELKAILDLAKQRLGEGNKELKGFIDRESKDRVDPIGDPKEKATQLLEAALESKQNEVELLLSGSSTVDPKIFDQISELQRQIHSVEVGSLSDEELKIKITDSLLESEKTDLAKATQDIEEAVNVLPKSTEDRLHEIAIALKAVETGKATMLRTGLKAFSQAVTANQMSRALKRPLREGLREGLKAFSGEAKAQRIIKALEARKEKKRTELSTVFKAIHSNATESHGVILESNDPVAEASSDADRQDRQRASIPSGLRSILNRGMRLLNRSKDMQAVADEATRVLRQGELSPLKPLEHGYPEVHTPQGTSSDSESSESGPIFNPTTPVSTRSLSGETTGLAGQKRPTGSLIEGKGD